MSFSWIPIYRELAQAVLAYQDRQEDLLNILRAAKQKGLPVMSIPDEGPHLRQGIDPFSFFAAFNRGQTHSNRREIIAYFQDRLGLQTQTPIDFDGIPTADNRSSFFFSAKSETMQEDLLTLWTMASEAYGKRAEEVSSALFDKCLGIKGISATNLTMGCFWINPEGFLALDGTNRAYFPQEFNIELGARNHTEYVALLGRVHEASQDSYADISLAAWKWSKSVQYWTFTPGRNGSEWERFVREGVMAIDEPIGDLLGCPTKDRIKNELRTATEKDWPFTVRAHACWDFSRIIKPGDVVFAKKGYSEVLGYGIVRGDYRHDPSRDDHAHIRDVEWHVQGGHLGEEGATKPAFAVKFLTNITPWPDFVKEFCLLTGYDPGNLRKYYWLNANPKIWSFESVMVGGECTYTSTNELGNKRNRYKCFQEARPGDILIGYVTTPKRAITAICEITKSLHASDDGEVIAFKKIRNVAAPVTYDELRTDPEIAESEPLKSAQGSLFKLTQSEYEHVLRMIDEKNPAETDPPEPPIPYTVDMAMDGLFMARHDFEGILGALREKHNIILQGAPGVGKTFVAGRVAYALIGEKAKDRVEMIQFHQSYSYEDFIQGYRPVSNGEHLKFELKNGVFYRFCQRAIQNPEKNFVFIIDEINRGNLSKIFGELMMLIEHDKRGDEFAVPLTYGEGNQAPFYVPKNLYLIGMMNTADRSLAMVDYALRRRFRFVEIEPGFETEAFRAHLTQTKGASAALVQKIIDRMSAVNADIAADNKNLGRGYRIGHSFFCPVDGLHPDEDWYARVIKNEIVPLLEEYWFDNPEKVERHRERLLS